MFKAITILCAVLVSFSFKASSAEQQSNENFQPSAEEKSIVDLTNKERQKEGFEPLQIDATLTQAARQHSSDMAKERKLTHELYGKGPDDRVKALNYKYFAVGENVAWNEPTPDAVVQGWMKSPGHRANILRKDFTAIGVGVAKDDKGQPYYTQVFARPQTAARPLRRNSRSSITLMMTRRCRCLAILQSPSCDKARRRCSA